jgi:hypothetical protein
MKTKQQIFEKIIRRIVKEELNKNKASNKDILNLVKRLKVLDSTDPESTEVDLIQKQLVYNKVMDKNGNFIYGHPLMDKIDAIWG